MGANKAHSIAVCTRSEHVFIEKKKQRLREMKAIGVERWVKKQWE
jgi:hypothetical protein